MRKSLQYGTATTLLVTMAASLVYAEPAYAASGAWDPSAMLYGPIVIDHELNDMYRMEIEMSSVATLVTGMAEGAALTAAGIELIRQIRKSAAAKRRSGEEEDEKWEDIPVSGDESENGPIPEA